MQVGIWKKIADLGSGAFGVVSLWQNTENDEYTAIKMCKFKADSSLTPRQKERWKNEVDKIKIINHPNIIKYKPIPEDLEEHLMANSTTSMPLLPMEYCRKGNLRHILQRPCNSSGLQEEDVRCILGDISSGLAHLHKLKVTHRDIKPDNIVLEHCEERKTKTIYKIIDLGYAKELGDSTVSFVGTLHYLAPEIFEAKSYNSSVDYWSMGILTFEIICGFLPFLANLTPFERFEKIRKKEYDDICIHVNYSGQIIYSQEIKKETYISPWLKEHLETWLRHVLTYDQNVRAENFPENVEPLQYLTNILQKKIVHVFSLCKLEYYSYEIIEGSLVGTLKDWISRDIKVPKDELLLFISKDNFNIQDNDELLNIIGNEYVYVTRKHFLPESLNYKFPKLIREVMGSPQKFNKNFLRGLISQFVFFVTQEKQIAFHFRTCFHVYLNFLNHILNTIKSSKSSASETVKQLVTRIDCYNKMKADVGNIDLKNNSVYEECLNHAQRLVAGSERSITNFSELERKIHCVSRRLKVLSTLTSNIIDIVSKYNLDEQFDKALILIDKAKINDPNKHKELLSGMRDIISNTIRVKEITFKNKQLVAFSTIVGNIMCHCFELLNWIKIYITYNEEIMKSFEQNKIIYLDILLKAAQKPKVESEGAASDNVSLTDSLNQELLSLPLPSLLHENQELRYEFEEALSSGISGHKNSVKCLKLL
ncbi:uncharacterized protein LOC126889951 [Diabrotica virgifera virgifera]|uniref:IkappaB kinase n=1 Tax=Diabrotica virgifera virgifera TaxID=50390 RepID=A0ABM5KWV2_DIAVI|nr:uncharacterized protein LOC126889951 [Diabrotica virgifera virgifera]